MYTELAGISRWKARMTHGLLSGLWVIFSMAGLAIVERHKFSQALPLFTTCGHSLPHFLLSSSGWCTST